MTAEQQMTADQSLGQMSDVLLPSNNRAHGGLNMEAKKGSLSLLILIVALFVMSTMFTVIYVSGEDGIYLWDYHGWWDTYKQLASYLRQVELRKLVWMFGSIAKSDYNIVPLVLLQPFAIIFGDGRIGYILAIVLLYLVPTALVVAYFGASISRTPIVQKTLLQTTDTPNFIVLVIVALTYPPFWIPTLRGYPDVGGLIPLGIAAILVTRGNFSNEFSIKRAAALGILLWSCFLFRKWYAYTIIAFILAAIPFSIMERNKNASKTERLKLVATMYATAAAIALSCGILIQPYLVFEALITDYRDIYQYHQTSATEHIESFVNFFGPSPLLLALIGSAIGMARPSSRSTTLFLLLNVSILCLLFTHTQAFGPHHYLPVSFWIFCLDAFAISFLIETISKFALSAILIVIVSIVIFWGTFFPLPRLAQQNLGWLLPPAKNYQLKFPNRPEYQRLLWDVEALVADGDKLSVLGYGYDGFADIISDDLLYALIGQSSNDWLVRTAHVDKRDRLQIEPLLARYIIVPDTLAPTPVGHPALPPWPPIEPGKSVIDQQQVEVVPAQRIRDGRGIGAAYERLPRAYKISGNVVHIFKKIRPFTLAEVDELLDQFFRLYPEWRADYDFARILLTSDLNSTDSTGNVRLELPGELKIWPGEARPIRISVSSSALQAGRIIGFAFSTKHAWSACAGQKDLPVKYEIGSVPIWQGDASSTESVVHLAYHGSEVVSLRVGPATQSGCEYLSVRPIFAQS